MSPKTTPIAPSIIVRKPVWPWLSSWKEEWVVTVFTRRLDATGAWRLLGAVFDWGA
ncbi:hypothetical protein GCM10027430_03750 [Lysobacter tyrosinilyticus]